MCGQPHLHTGLAQWIERLATNQGLLGVRISQPVPKKIFRTLLGFEIFVFIAFSSYLYLEVSKMSLNQKLIIARGRKCEQCGITQWLGQPINLEVHHIDFNHQNNNEENLILLCPNCHSYTENHSKNIYQNNVSEEELVQALLDCESIREALLKVGLSTAGANYSRVRALIQKHKIEKFYIKERKFHYCLDCGAPIDEEAVRCRQCANLNNRFCDRPTREELKKLIREQSFVSIGRLYNVSDNAIRKWCDAYCLPRTKTTINKYSDEDWARL